MRRSTDALILFLLALVVICFALRGGAAPRERFGVDRLIAEAGETAAAPYAAPSDRAVNVAELRTAETRPDGTTWARSLTGEEVPEYPPEVMDASCSGSVSGCPSVPYRNPLYQYSSSYGTGEVGADVGPTGCNDLGLPAQWKMFEDDHPFDDADGDYYSDQWKGARLAVQGPVYNYSQPDALGLTC